MDELLQGTELKMSEAIENMKKRFTNVRAGRANPAILDGVMVTYYGNPTSLKQLATISVPEARQLLIKPFDKSCLGDIEKGIFEANIGLTPNNNGEAIILNIPALTEDTRKEYVKQVKGIAEDCHIHLRNIRQDANNSAKKLEDITEDDKTGISEDIEDLINKDNKQVDELIKDNENEIITS